MQCGLRARRGAIPIFQVAGAEEHQTRSTQEEGGTRRNSTAVASRLT